jgi:hypothetical protein
MAAAILKVAIALVPGLVAKKMCETMYPPAESTSLKIGQVVEHHGIPHKIIGATGHSSEVISFLSEHPEAISKPLYFADLKTAHRYAQMNVSRSGRPEVALLGVREGRSIVLDEQRFEGPYVPISPVSLRDQSVVIVEVQKSDETTDPSFSACFRRMLKDSGVAFRSAESFSSFLRP